MRLPMVDCRSLIEFCRAFEQHKNMMAAATNSSSSSSSSSVLGVGVSDQNRTNNHNKKHSNCGNSFNPFAAVDVLMLILVVGALGFLTIPYFKLIFNGALEILPAVCDLVGDVILNAPVAYVVGLVVAFTGVIGTIAAWEILDFKSRKCGKPHCKGLRKAIEFDIQLESEECVKYSLPPVPTTAAAAASAASASSYEEEVKPLELLGQDHKELEAELKRMAPLNGRTVLIFRSPCGCPVGRLEVWGPKKIRRIKK